MGAVTVRLIEQAIARGETPSQIMRRHGCDYETVRTVRLAMDRACADTLCRYRLADLAAEQQIVAANRARADWAAQVSMSQTMRDLEARLQAWMNTTRTRAMSA